MQQMGYWLNLDTAFSNFFSSSPAAYIRSNQIMGWGEKAIEIRSVETGHLDGVFMHKRAQRLKFLCERNDKVIVLPALTYFLFPLL